MQSSEKPLRIVTDATFVESEHIAGIAAILLDETEAPRFAIGKQVSASNIVEGELKAILYAIEDIPSDGVEVFLQSDNQNAVLLLNGEAGTSFNEMKIVGKIHNRIEQKHLTITFKWTPRENNHVADAVATISARNASVWARP